MRIGIFADAHDHLDNIRKAVEMFNTLHCELVVFAGDLVSTIAILRYGRWSVLLLAVSVITRGIGLVSIAEWRSLDLWRNRRSVSEQMMALGFWSRINANCFAGKSTVAMLLSSRTRIVRQFGVTVVAGFISTPAKPAAGRTASRPWRSWIQKRGTQSYIRSVANQ